MRKPPPNDPLRQALFAARQLFDNRVAVERYRDYLVAMFFLKWLSDNPHATDGRLILPPESNFYRLYAARWQPGNAARITNAFVRLEDANGDLVRMLVLDVHFNALGDGRQRDDLLSQLLAAFGKAPLAFAAHDSAAQAAIDAVFVELVRQLDPLCERNSGIYYTPRYIAQWMVDLLQPQAGETVYDPLCGIGSLLVASVKAGCTLFGQEMNVRLGALARMRLLMMNIPAGNPAHLINAGDSIGAPSFLQAADRLQQFDMVLAHLPTSLQVWGARATQDDRFGRFAMGVPPINRSQYAFILHMLASMKPDTGRMAVLLPQGALFRAGPEGAIRRNLVQANVLDAVIGLPSGAVVDRDGDSVLLLFRHGKVDEDVFFIAAQRSALLAHVIGCYQARASVPGFAQRVSEDDIAAQDFRLDIGRYVRGKAALEDDFGVGRALLAQRWERDSGNNDEGGLLSQMRYGAI